MLKHLRFSTIVMAVVLLATACSVSLDMTTRVTDLDNISHDLEYSYPDQSSSAQEDDLGAFDSRYCTKAEEDDNIVVTCSGVPHSLLLQARAVGEESSLQISATRKDLGGQWEYRVAMANPFIGQSLQEGDLTWVVNLPGKIVNSNADFVSENDGRAEFNADLEDSRVMFFAESVKDKAGEPTLPPRCDNGIAVTNPEDNTVLVEDCEALLASVDILAGSGILNWSAQVPLSQWDGVVIEGNPARITGLYLYSRELTGQIPDQLGKLTGLETLWLHDNRLNGELPTELGGLSLLEQLSLSRNRLSGGLPPALGNLTSLEFMSLSRNQLSGGLPPALGNLSNLEELWLYRNDLSGEIPPELGNLTNLALLRLDRNQLAGEIPRELGNLSNVTLLDLEWNQLTGEVPAELGNLSNLQEMRLSENDLSGEIPAELGNLANLTLLLLDQNQLTGEIPAELGNLSSLTRLALGWNQLTGEIPAELGNLLNLQYLWLHGNDLSGEIPAELGNLTTLISLSLSENELTGCVPAVLERAYWGDDHPICEAGIPTPISPAPPAAPTPPAPPAAPTPPAPPAAMPTPTPTPTPAPTPAALPDICGDAVPDRTNVGLVADCNALLAAMDTLRGTADLDWSSSTAIARWDGITLGGEPRRVSKIKLQKRELTGRIPAEFGRLDALEELWLYNNELTGTIPPELGDLNSLHWLFVSTNKLSGQIPETLNNLSLDRLWLHKNSFTGCVPYNLTLTREYKVDGGLSACAPPTGE